MATLTITRGLPGSGKTTWAQRWVAEAAGRARVNRDDIRATMFGVTGKARLARDVEQVITAVQQAAVRRLLRAGYDVVVDDLNLRLRFAQRWADLAAEVGAGFEVNDTFLDAPVERCIARDARRYPGGVGEEVIRGLYAEFLADGGGLPPVTPARRVR